MTCPLCDKVVDIMKGPEEYIIMEHRVWHRQCYEKHNKFMGCGQVVHKTKTKIEEG